MKAYKVFEIQSFERNSNPINSMKIGVLEKIEDYMAELKNRFSYDKWNFKINEDLTIDIFWYPLIRNHVFDLSNSDFKILPEYIRFNKVDGHFSCCWITKDSLKFFPKEINGACIVFSYDPIEITVHDIRAVSNVEEKIKITQLGKSSQKSKPG